MPENNKQLMAYVMSGPEPGTSKLGSSISPLAREKQCRAVAPRMRLVFTMPIESRDWERAMHRELQKTGLARGRGIYAIEPSDLVAIVTGGVPSNPLERQRILRQVLDAELAPGLSVEEACHANIYNLSGDEMSRGINVVNDLSLLFSAGLDIDYETDKLPAAIVISSPEKFLAKFPHLAHALPVLIFGQGVQPYTNGKARVEKKQVLDETGRAIPGVYKNALRLVN